MRFLDLQDRCYALCSREFIDLFFRFLVACTLCAGFYRSLWLDIRDPYKCKALTTSGRWLGSVNDSHVTPSSSSSSWQPKGCIMHQYSGEDMQTCFNGVSMHGHQYFHKSLDFAGIGNPVLMGDSTIRHLFWAVARKLDSTKATLDESLAEKHSDVNFTTPKFPGLKLHFLWKPFLEDIAATRLWSDLNVTANSTENSTAYARTSAHPFMPFYDSMIAGSSSWQPGQLYALPKSLVVGVPGLWHAKQDSNTTVSDFLNEFDTVAAFMEKHVVVPIQPPWYQYLSEDRAAITPDKIEAMQQAVRGLPSTTKVLWSLNEMLTGQAGAYESDGIHVIDMVANSQADVLLNAMCNEHLANLREAGPSSSIAVSDYSCCNDYTSIWNTGVAGILIIMVFLFLGLQSMPGLDSFINTRVLCAASTIVLAVMLCMLTDRSPLFEKVNKSFRVERFIVPCIIALILGLFTIRKVPQRSNSLTSELVWLCREQSDEWKGWMQIVILVYHYTGASKVLWAYQLARLLVASYLFMTGYGHTLYFLRNQDFSLKRIGTVLLRTNLLTFLLPYAMGDNYLFYYFPPLASFWFLVVYISIRTLSTLGHVSRLCRLMVLVLVTIWAPALLFSVMPILEVLSSTFKINLYSEEFAARVFLDLYPSFGGTLFAIFVHNRSSLLNRLYNPNDDCPHSSTVKRLVRYFHYFCALSLVAYFILLREFTSRESSNTLHRFTSIIPIVAFLFLRNSIAPLRTHYSAFFAWLGRYSLETYILQYHLWLAADTHGLLRLGLLPSWCETLLFTGLFLWGSVQVGKSIAILSKWMIEGGEKPPEPLPFKDIDLENLSASPSKEKGLSMRSLRSYLSWEFPPARMWRRSLKSRLTSILVAMWLLNWLYDFGDLQRLFGFDFVAWKRHMIT